MHHSCWLEAGKNLLHCGSVAYIGFDKSNLVIAEHGIQGFQISGIGKFIQNADHATIFLDNPADKSRTNESGSAGYEYPQVFTPLMIMGSKPRCLPRIINLGTGKRTSIKS
jgi:hypothetical protein